MLCPGSESWGGQDQTHPAPLSSRGRGIGGTEVRDGHLGWGWLPFALCLKEWVLLW